MKLFGTNDIEPEALDARDQLDNFHLPSGHGWPNVADEMSMISDRNF